MKHVLIAFLLAASGAFAGVPGQPTGTVLSAEPAVISSPSTTLNASCATPATGCSGTPGSSVSIKLGGRSNVSFQIVSANLTATFGAYISMDNGVNWISTPFRASVISPASGASNDSRAGDSTIRQYALLLPYGTYTNAMVAITAYTGGSTAATLVASAFTPGLGALFATKGTQPLTGGFGTQDLKDAGRTVVVLGADGVTPAIADTVITFSKNVAGTVTGAQTTYAITSGKILRIQSLCASFTPGAAANIARVRLRLNTGGACIAGSGLLLPAMELAPQFGTATASEGWAGQCVPIPDGLELTGASWNICLSESAVAASGTLTVNLIGYEY